jgi:hypothetical protein
METDPSRRGPINWGNLLILGLFLLLALGIRIAQQNLREASFHWSCYGAVLGIALAAWGWQKVAAWPRTRVGEGFHRTGTALGGTTLLAALFFASTSWFQSFPADYAGASAAFVVASTIIYGLSRGIAWVVEGFLS